MVYICLRNLVGEEGRVAFTKDEEYSGEELALFNGVRFIDNQGEGHLVTTGSWLDFFVPKEDFESYNIEGLTKVLEKEKIYDR